MESADTLTISTSEGLSVQLAFLIMVHLSGLLLNLTCLFVICSRYKALELKRRYILLGNLLLCDFALLFWVLPVTIRLLTCGTSECRATVLHPAVCAATAFTFQCSYLCGMVTQVLLALDRTLTTAHPCLSSRYLTGKVYVSTVALSWAYAGVHASLPLVPELTGVTYVFSDLVKKCTHSFRHSCWYYSYTNILVHGVLGPSILLCYMYMAFRIWQLRRTYDSEQVMLLENVQSLSTNSQKNSPCSRSDLNGTPRSNALPKEYYYKGHFIPYTGGATFTWAHEASEAVEISPEFLHVRRQPMAVTHQGVQTSLSKLSSSLTGDELDEGSTRNEWDEGSRTSETLNTVVTWQSGPFVDTTIASLTSQALSQLNYVPSDVSDLKGFIHSQQQDLNSELSSCTIGTRKSSRARWLSGARRHGSQTLSAATTASLQHGICLVVVSYAWSLPYSLATKCPRGEMPFNFSVTSMWLCYSSCIFYPLVYFFMHDSFVRHLRVSISSL